MTETPVTDQNGNIVTVNVDEGDDIIDLHAEDGASEVDVRITVNEALALIASLTVAISEAVRNS